MFENQPIEFRLKQAVTAFDRKNKERAARSRRGYHNPYALPQYFRAIDDIIQEVNSGRPLRVALCEGLSGRLLDVCLIAIGEPRSTSDEQRMMR